MTPTPTVTTVTIPKKTAISPPQTETIHCLSIRQPYADDVFFGGKWAENRSRRTKHLGELWIHASSLNGNRSEYDPSPTNYACGYILGRVNLQRCVSRLDLLSAATPDILKMLEVKNPGHTGKDVDFCRLLLERIDPDTWQHVGETDYVWIFSEPEMLHEPIKIGGKLGVWTHQIETQRLGLADGRKKKWKFE